MKERLLFRHQGMVCLLVFGEQDLSWSCREYMSHDVFLFRMKTCMLEFWTTVILLQNYTSRLLRENI